MPAAHHQPIHRLRSGLVAEPDGEVGEPADDPAVGPQHVLSGHPAEQQHARSMPYSTA